MSKEAQRSGFTHESQNNISVDWYTPGYIFDILGLSFDLDPCSPKGGLPWVPAKTHYSLEDDGLNSAWFGRVWLNPPYGKHTAAWLEKMNSHRNGVALVFARTDCKWFHEFVMRADAILFTKGRLKFVDGLGVTQGTGAGAGSVFVAWGAENVNSLQKLQCLGSFIHLARQASMPMNDNLPLFSAANL